MGIDFKSLLVNPTYAALGVGVVLTLADARVFDSTVDKTLGIVAIDKTDGIDVGDHVGVPTVTPVAAIRQSDLDRLDLDAEDLLDSTLEMNGAIWNVTNSKPRPNPSGQASGELYLMLTFKEKP